MELSKPIHVLRREAKKAAREQGIKLNEALDRIAREEGYASWSLLAARNPKATDRPKVESGNTEITALPLIGPDRAEFIELANFTFERVLDRIEAENPEATRALWDADDYIDNHLLSEGMLPIDRDYALSLIEAHMVHHVVPLAVEADKAAAT